MRALVQRVKRARVSIGQEVVAEIDHGLLVFLGIKEGDQERDARLLAEKIANLRIMADENDKMNLSILDIKGEILVISQFTLYADTSYGRRPSFIKAAKPEVALSLYEKFVKKLKEQGISVKTGKFGEYMEVELVNDGPVTIMIESEAKQWKKEY
jgi:D-tyrosyl-tRNA(Tyr) deacylase